MKGQRLAGYLMIVGLTLATGTSSAATPQQEDSESFGRGSTLDATTKTAAHDRTGSWRPLSDSPTSPGKDLTGIGSHIFEDQKEIWMSPLKIRLPDMEWLVPVLGITSGMILTDASLSKALSSSPKTLETFGNLRTGSVAALGAASGGFYLWSLKTHDPHQRETGLLAGEALFDSLIVTQGIKFVASRERPLAGNGQGRFFEGGTSFPSSHSAAAWAVAGIVAHEYHGPLTKLLAYGLASTVSVASVGSKQHFASDVLIGSGLGWMVSEYVYRSRHNPEVGGAAWNSVREIAQGGDSGPVKNSGSTYVPLDSWVYRAFDRLAALGYVSGGFQGKRPWSRQQCARLLVDVDERIAHFGSSKDLKSGQIETLVQALHHEFAREEFEFSGSNQSADVESVYTRLVSASGSVLNDGYHFGQTFAYDDGRPFREGTNLIDGVSASATYGSLFFYVNGEYQHAPSQPALSPAISQFIVERDKGPAPPEGPFAPVNQFRFLDAYAGINVQGWQLTFGNQSLSWGPGIGGSLLLSDNAAPFPMLRISPDHALEIPGFSKIFGPSTIEQFFGRLDGHPGTSQPWIYGQSISIKPLPSLEFAYSRTTLIGGTGHPLTANSFFLSMFGRVDPVENSVPGDSRTAVDWTWRLPGLHDWITFYGELEDDDDLIPLQNVAKSVWRPGIYFSRLPYLPKWDLHFEWTSSTSPGRASFQDHGNLNYWNLDYPAGYTNASTLMGNIVGREGVTSQAWLRYWASPRHTLDLSWKQSRVLSDYVPGGGKWQDFQISYSATKRSGVYLKGLVQFEHISSYPLLFTGSRDNVTAAVELGFLPPWGHQAASTSGARSAADALVQVGSAQ